MAVFRNVVGTPATPQFLEVLWRGIVGTTPSGARTLVQVYHFNQLAIVPILEDIDSLMVSLKTQLDTALKNALSVDYVGIDIRGRFMDDPSSPDVLCSVAPSNGLVSGDRLPVFNAATIQIRSSARGRSFRGSKHFAPVAESQTTEEALTGTGLTQWQAVQTALRNITLAGANGSQWQLIILSRVLSDLTSNPAVFTFASQAPDAAGAILNVKVGSMTRRKRNDT